MHLLSVFVELSRLELLRSVEWGRKSHHPAPLLPPGSHGLLVGASPRRAAQYTFLK